MGLTLVIIWFTFIITERRLYFSTVNKLQIQYLNVLSNISLHSLLCVCIVIKSINKHIAHHNVYLISIPTATNC